MGAGAASPAYVHMNACMHARHACKGTCVIQSKGGVPGLILVRDGWQKRVSLFLSMPWVLTFVLAASSPLEEGIAPAPDAEAQTATQRCRWWCGNAGNANTRPVRGVHAARALGAKAGRILGEMECRNGAKNQGTCAVPEPNLGQNGQSCERP